MNVFITSSKGNVIIKTQEPKYVPKAIKNCVQSQNHTLKFHYKQPCNFIKKSYSISIHHISSLIKKQNNKISKLKNCNTRESHRAMGIKNSTLKSTDIKKATSPILDGKMKVELAAGSALGEFYDKEFPDNYRNRRVGIIMHPTSFPGPYGCGEIGKEAFRFIDWLVSAACQCWQVLPLVPPDQLFYSPYTGLDSNCGNPLLISIDTLIDDELITREEAPTPDMTQGRTDFHKVTKIKTPILKLAAQRILYDERFNKFKDEMEEFRKENPWIEDSALFEQLRTSDELKGKVWWEWPAPIRFRTDSAMNQAKEVHKNGIDEFIAIQYLFNKQWCAVKDYATKHNISIIGDMPIYVGGHSADVWANQDLFELSETRAPCLVSGVPPDAFSATGQLWGTPLYNWPNHKKNNYDWWAQRLGRAFQLFHECRIDHFRGFAGYWAVEADEETAINGVWKKGPGKELFDILKTKLGNVMDNGIIAEDLGMITADVHQLRDDTNIPGMVVLQFAFGSGSENTHLTHMHTANAVVYPGTHDNQTAVGWYRDSCQENEKLFLKEYINCDDDDIAWSFIRESMKSVARTCIILLQDIMRLDNAHRMNIPGKSEGNWNWRVEDQYIWENLKKEAKDLRNLCRVYNRLPKGWKY